VHEHSSSLPQFPHYYSKINAQWHVLKLNKSGPDFVVLHHAKLPLILTFNIYENLEDNCQLIINNLLVSGSYKQSAALSPATTSPC